MKKAWAFLTAVFLLVMCTACGEKDISLDPVAVADKLAGNIKFNDQMTALDNDAALSLYELDSGTVAKQKVYVSTGATAEEISVWEAKDKASAAKVEQAVKDRIEDQKAGFKDYVPAEMAKLNTPVLEASGKYVILCLSNHNDTAKKIIGDYLKETK